MQNADPADVLEAILIAENEALARHDPDAAATLLTPKLAAAKALSAESMCPEQAERLRHLAAENRRLLELAINVQREIVTIIAHASLSNSAPTRYGAEGRTVPPDTGRAIARQA